MTCKKRTYALFPGFAFVLPPEFEFHAAQVSFSARLTAYTVATFTSAQQDGYMAMIKGTLAYGGANCQVSITGVRAGSVIVDTKARPPWAFVGPGTQESWDVARALLKH